MTATSSAWATLTRPTASFNAISMAGAEDELMHMIVHVFDLEVKGKPWEVEEFFRSVVRKFLVNAASHDPIFRLSNAWHSKHENIQHVLENVRAKHTQNSDTENRAR